jgi:hypothetical protein
MGPSDDVLIVQSVTKYCSAGLAFADLSYKISASSQSTCLELLSDSCDSSLEGQSQQQRTFWASTQHRNSIVLLARVQNAGHHHDCW